MREGSGADATDGGMGAPDSTARVTSREFFMACRNISLCCFHFEGVLGLRVDVVDVAGRLWPCPLLLLTLILILPRLGVLGAVPGAKVCCPAPAASLIPWWELELLLLGV